MYESRLRPDRRQVATGGRRSTDVKPDEFCVDTRVKVASLLVTVQRLTDAVQVLTAAHHKPEFPSDSDAIHTHRQHDDE
jgi:hypothetical protein